MHDIKAIRADPAAFDAGLMRRGYQSTALSLVAIDQQIRIAQTNRDSEVARQRDLGRELAGGMSGLNALRPSNGDPFQDGIASVLRRSELKLDLALIKGNIAEFDRTATEFGHRLRSELEVIPNLPADDVPVGFDEGSNVKIHARPSLRPAGNFEYLEHDTLALKFGYDPDAAAAISGARFAVLKGPLARLHRALGQFMIDRHTAENGYTEVAPPLLVRADALFGTGQLPKFEDDLFKTTGDNPHYLIPTAEVSLTNLVREKILDAADLPLRFTALTPCFRSEAGSAGRDTRGLIRQHQFDKVELVAIVADAEAAAAEHERMTAHAEGILDALGLPYRRMLLCAGDMGFAARKTYDLEVWLPGQGAYREISSVSDCGDFQARRMDARYKVKGQKGTSFVHTLNGSALAVGRTLVAVIENYQRADGSVAVPAVLAPYMGGVTELLPS